jgi:hypothetical protein
LDDCRAKALKLFLLSVAARRKDANLGTRTSQFGNNFICLVCCCLKKLLLSTNVWRGIHLMSLLHEPLDCFGADPNTASYSTAFVLRELILVVALCEHLGIILNSLTRLILAFLTWRK